MAISAVAMLAGCGMGWHPPTDESISLLFAATAPTEPVIVARGVEIPDHPAAMSDEFGDRRIRSLINGGEIRLGMQASRNRLHLKSADGCSSIRLLDWFSPSLAWSGCGRSRHWHTAEARVAVEDPLYPLTLGAEGRYQRWAVSHTGKESTRVTYCRVDDAVTIDLGDRRTDAFEVNCDDGRIVRTTWYAPGEGPVAYREVHSVRGVREAWVVAD